MAANTSHGDVHVSLFMPETLRAELERSARESDRSLSAQIRVRLRAAGSFERSGAAASTPPPPSPSEGKEGLS